MSLHQLALNTTLLLTALIRSVTCTRLARMAISHCVTQVEFRLTFAEPNTFHKSMLPSHKVCFLPKKYAPFGNPAQLHLSSPPHRFSPNLSPRCVSRQRQSIPHKPRAWGLAQTSAEATCKRCGGEIRQFWPRQFQANQAQCEPLVSTCPKVSLNFSRFQTQIAILMGSAHAKLKPTACQHMLVGANRTPMHPAVFITCGQRKAMPRWVKSSNSVVLEGAYLSEKVCSLNWPSLWRAKSAFY